MRLRFGSSLGFDVVLLYLFQFGGPGYLQLGSSSTEIKHNLTNSTLGPYKQIVATAIEPVNSTLDVQVAT